MRFHCWMLGALLLGAGCGSEPATGPEARTGPVQPAWQLKEQELKAKLRIGMSQQEVQQQLGEPAETKALLRAGDEMISWSYPLADNIQFVVHFNAQGKLTSFKAVSPIGIQSRLDAPPMV